MNNNVATLIGWAMISIPSLTASSETNNPVFAWISAIVTIGGFVLMMVNYCINWYRNAKSDGKISADEIQELTNKLTNKVEELEKQLEEKDNGK